MTVAVISMAEVVRAGRFLNMLLGSVLIVAPWLLAGATTGGRWNSIMIGVAVIALSLPCGIIRERYAAWSRLVR